MDPATCGGGPLAFDDGHHKFALGWFFMGQAEEVHAWIGRTESSLGEVLDSPAIVSWKFANGRMGNLEVVYSRDLEIDTVHYAQDDRVEITGTRGVIWVNRGHGRLFDQPPLVLYADDEVRSFGMDAGWEASFAASTRHHIEALLEGKPPFLTGRQGAEILRFALAAQESARIGRAVRVGG
jgi:predicted dehydrogenase